MQYIVRLVADGQSNGGFTSTTNVARFVRERGVGSTLRVSKAHGRMDEESRRWNLRKIPWRPMLQQPASLLRSRF